jgi:hypothetical protein
MRALTFSTVGESLSCTNMVTPPPPHTHTHTHTYTYTIATSTATVPALRCLFRTSSTSRLEAVLANRDAVLANRSKRSRPRGAVEHGLAIGDVDGAHLRETGRYPESDLHRREVRGGDDYDAQGNYDAQSGNGHAIYGAQVGREQGVAIDAVYAVEVSRERSEASADDPGDVIARNTALLHDARELAIGDGGTHQQHDGWQQQQRQQAHAHPHQQRHHAQQHHDHYVARRSGVTAPPDARTHGNGAVLALGVGHGADSSEDDDAVLPTTAGENALVCILLFESLSNPFLCALSFCFVDF